MLYSWTTPRKTNELDELRLNASVNAYRFEPNFPNRKKSSNDWFDRIVPFWKDNKTHDRSILINCSVTRAALKLCLSQSLEHTSLDSNPESVQKLCSATLT
ncbi:hypothetical protein ACROYT_G013384 [Oculina patagonica]